MMIFDDGKIKNTDKVLRNNLAITKRYQSDIEKTSINKLNNTWRRHLNITDYHFQLMEDEVTGNQYIEDHLENLLLLCKKIETDIHTCNDSEVIDGNIFNKVHNNYIKIMNKIFDYKQQKLEKQFNIYNSKMTQIEDRVNQNLKELDIKVKETIDSNEMLKKDADGLKEKLESVGSMVLNMIISFSFVSAMVSGIDKISNPIYIPMFVICGIWLSMTNIIFVSFIFKKNSKIPDQAMTIYKIYTFVTVTCVIITFLTAIQ